MNRNPEWSGSLFNKRYESYNEKLYQAIKVKEIMTPNVVIIQPDALISLVADFFAKNLFHALPVVGEGKLLGIIASQDLLSYCFRGGKIIWE